MPVVIRLSRCGTKHKPKYRVTVGDSRRYVTSKFLDIVGSYVPKVGVQKESINLEIDKIKDWMAKGAQPTQTVKHLMKKAQAQK